MKKMIFPGVLVFSLALNVAVVATLVWHGWFEGGALPLQGSEQSVVTSPDLREIRSNWPGNGLSRMRENRERILEKKREILDLISQNPGNPRARGKAVVRIDFSSSSAGAGSRGQNKQAGRDHA